MSDLLTPLIAELGWDAKADEPAQTKRLRDLILILGARVEIPAIIDEGLKRFKAFKQPADLASDIRGCVYYIGAKYGTKADFDKLLKLHNSSKDADDREEMLAGLSATKDQDRIKLLISMLTSKNVRLQDVPTWFVFLIRNRYAKTQTWNWVKDNWSWIDSKYGTDKSFDRFARYSATAFSRQEELKDYTAFFKPKMADIGLTRVVQLGIQEIEGRIKWRQNNEHDLRIWLDKKY